MQAPARDFETVKSFGRAITLGAWVAGHSRNGGGSGGRAAEHAAALLPPDDGTDRPMTRPSARGQAATDAHRRDWP